MKITKIDEDKGRCAVTSSKLTRAGDVVLRTNSLVPCVLKKEFWDDRCWHCFGRIQSKKRCSQCKLVHYCSTTCHKRNWKLVHKKECEHLEQIHGKLGPGACEDVLLMARVLCSSPDEGILEKLKSMENHPEDEEGMHECMELAGFVLEMLHRTKLSLLSTDHNEVCNMMMRFKYNNFAVVDELFIAIGAGIYPEGALLNHSCDPNCVLTYAFNPSTNAMEQIIRCIYDIDEEGVELCHSYCEIAWPRPKRQMYLKETYFFSCSCPHCTPGNDPAWDAIEEELAEDASPPQRNKLYDADCLHLGLLPLHGEALTVALESGDNQLAAILCAKIVKMYEKVYKIHPLLALNYFTLGDLLLMLGQDKKAKSTFEKALKMLRVTHGAESGLYIGLEERMKQNNLT